MSPLLAQDPLHSIRPAHDVTSIHARHCFAITRWPLPRVGTFGPAGEAACVTTRVAARPSSCFLGTPAGPSQSWCVRRRSDRSCRCGVTWRLIAGPNGWRRSARLHRESLPAPGHCEALERCQASHIGEAPVAPRASVQPGGRPKDLPISCRNVSLSGTMSDGRSRSGGIWMSKTPRR